MCRASPRGDGHCRGKHSGPGAGAAAPGGQVVLYTANIYNYQQQLGNSRLMFSELPDYRVVLLGYSLGAGVVPLLALALLQVLL
jgi:hypothetical protein